MKTLLVLRHAKSAYPEGVADHERPLAERGERDAAAAAHWLHEHGLRPEVVVCSTATRTRQTWERLAPHFAEPGPAVRFDERVYEAPASRLATLLRETDPAVGCVLLVGHNPGCEDLVLALCDHGDSGPSARCRRSTRPAGWPSWTSTVIGAPWPRARPRCGASWCRAARAPAAGRASGCRPRRRRPRSHRG